MALVLNTNSYVTVVQADTYFETRMDSGDWVVSSDEIKEQALVTATQLIDDSAWIGSAISASQSLAWPRKSAIYTDRRLGLVITIAVDEKPSRVKTAVFEQALHLIANEDLLGGGTQTFESISVGSVSISDSNNDVGRTPMIAATAKKLIRPLLVNGSNGAAGSGDGWWRAN